MRAVWPAAFTWRRRLHLQLRVHVLPELRSADRTLPELRRRAGSPAPPRGPNVRRRVTLQSGGSPADGVLAARLAAQRLSGPPARSALEATRHLLAIQAQDPTGARLAIRARSRSRHASRVDRALNAGSLVITWVNRGTLHLIAAEDEPLLHALTTPQLRTRSDRRLDENGVMHRAPCRMRTA